MIKNEWKNLLHNKIMFVVVIAIIAIPIIYAGLFLKSMWDPYGSVGHLPVAVVNEDKPVDYDGTTLSVGKDMVEELRENDSMAFNFVDSRTAEDGLENGTYYMVITIPEDFSANAATLMDDEPKKMELKYETNPGTNYIASKLSETALLKIKDAVATKVTETYTQTIFDQIAKVGDGMQDAADGSGEAQGRHRICCQRKPDHHPESEETLFQHTDLRRWRRNPYKRYSGVHRWCLPGK